VRRRRQPYSDSSPKLQDRRGFLISPARPVLGIEVEFQVFCDGNLCTPEALFGTAGTLFPIQQVPWTGKPVGLPHGGVVYFDRGVIEVVTPPIELSKTAARDAVQCLWQQINWVRRHLDNWQKNANRIVQLRGFSAHYNVSFDTRLRNECRSLERLSYLLVHILPFAAIPIATNDRSTGVGVRPRRNRIEITIDFTPDSERTIAVAGVIVGVARAVMNWKRYSVSQAVQNRLPLIRPFRPMKHTSRSGWLAHSSSYDKNPFNATTFGRSWKTQNAKRRSGPSVSRSIVKIFWPSISLFLDRRARWVLRKILNMSAAFVRGYRNCDNYYDVRATDASQAAKWSDGTYASLLAKFYQGRKIRVRKAVLRPVRVLGWFVVEFRDICTAKRHVMTLDEILSNTKITRSRFPHTGLLKQPSKVPSNCDESNKRGGALQKRVKTPKLRQRSR
jgi:hypothetical protein